MKDLKILLLLCVIVGVLYWGIEPLAHKVFYPKTEPADFEFSDLKNLPTTGNVENGKQLVATYCASCHSVVKDGLEGLSKEDAIAAYGIVPPDLSTAGAIYDSKFLANLIKNPVETLKLTHKFNDEKPFPMIATDVSDEELGDIVAYLKSIGDEALENQIIESDEFKTKSQPINNSNLSPSAKERAIASLQNDLKGKQVFINACSRCHSMNYDKVDALVSNVENYLGSKAPDLSMMIRSRNIDRLHVFINDPQKIILGTPMPRIGLNEDAQNALVNYMEKVGDSKKEERKTLGFIIIGFMLLMTIVAYLWKVKIWRNVK